MYLEEKLDSSKIVISKDDKSVEIIKEQEVLVKDINGNSLQIKDENTKVVELVTSEKTQDVSQIIVNIENTQELENKIQTSTILKDSLNSENILIVQDEIVNDEAIKNEVIKNENKVISENVLIIQDEAIKSEDVKINNNTKVDLTF